jgi:hypothetical protein
MINIKFKNLFLFTFLIIFFFIIFYFEFKQNKQNVVSKLEKVKIVSGYNDNVFNSYANILISERITYNKDILNFSKVEISEARSSEIKPIIIIFDYLTDDDKNSKFNKIKNEIIFINKKLKEEIFRYLDNKTEYLLLPEQTKILINHYKNKKDYEFINLIVINEQIEVAIKKEENIIRFIHYLIISFFLSFIFSFFFNYFLKNKKDLLNFFDKL